MASSKQADFEDQAANFPYAELEALSAALRQAAFDFASSLAEIDPSSPEIQLLIKSLAKIHSDDIKHMDRALMNFKKAFAGMVMRSNDNSIFGPNITEEQLPILTERYMRFIAETIAISEKAFELEESSRGEE